MRWGQQLFSEELGKATQFPTGVFNDRAFLHKVEKAGLKIQGVSPQNSGDMIAKCANWGVPAPEWYEDDPDDFRVVLKRPVTESGVEKTEQKSRVESSVKSRVKSRVKSSVKKLSSSHTRRE